MSAKRPSCRHGSRYWQRSLLALAPTVRWPVRAAVSTHWVWPVRNKQTGQSLPNISRFGVKASIATSQYRRIVSIDQDSSRTSVTTPENLQVMLSRLASSRKSVPIVHRTWLRKSLVWRCDRAPWADLDDDRQTRSRRAVVWRKSTRRRPNRGPSVARCRD